MAAPFRNPFPLRRRPIDWLLSPINEFLALEAAGGILLLGATIAALLWANSPWAASYDTFWRTYLTLEIGSFVLKLSLAHWINDGLMVVFFFVVGLEIKREMLVGELASLRKAWIPIAAAAGGMAVPAAIYAATNAGGEGMRGWAVPCATDIAFALGILALLGSRVPIQLKVFLTALAIVDDLGAVLIIAIFYTGDLSMTALGVAGVVIGLLVLANILHVRRTSVYVVLGAILWLAVLKSGVHATIAGVLLAMAIPAKVRFDGAGFVKFSRQAVDEFAAAGGDDNDIMTNPQRQRWLHSLESACESVHAPSLRLEHFLHPWTSILIVPLFALANAGVPLGEGLGTALTSRIGLGVILGLVLGKQVGVTLFTWLAVRLNLGQLPENVTWKQIYGASWLAGIGFTMSMFIANLGFGEGAKLEMAKIGVLAGSLVAGVVGFVLLRFCTSAGKST